MFVSLGNGVFYTPFLQIFSFTLITRAHRLRIQNGGWLLSYTTYLKRGGITLVLNQRHTKDSLHCSQPTYYLHHLHHYLQCVQCGGGTLGISAWGCAAGTLEPLTYTRDSSAEFCYP